MNELIYIIRNGLVMSNHDISLLHSLYQHFAKIDSVFKDHVEDLFDPTIGKPYEKDLLADRHRGINNATAVIALLTTDNAGDIAFDIAFAQTRNLPIYIIRDTNMRNIPTYVTGLEPLFHFTYSDISEIPKIAEKIRRLEKSPVGAPLVVNVGEFLQNRDLKKMRDVYLLSKNDWKKLGMEEAARTEVITFFEKYSLKPQFLR